MSIRDPKKWQPGWAVPPGDTIREAMIEKGWTQAQLAVALRYHQSYTSDILRSKRAISVTLALRLEAVFGVSAEFWLGLQQGHDLAVARRMGAA